MPEDLAQESREEKHARQHARGLKNLRRRIVPINLQLLPQLSSLVIYPIIIFFAPFGPIFTTIDLGAPNQQTKCENTTMILTEIVYKTFLCTWYWIIYIVSLWTAHSTHYQ